MEENLNRVLEKLDFILGLVRDCNYILKRIESRGKSRHINSVLSDDVGESKVVDVYVFSTITSVVENPLANSDTQIIDEIHEFSERTSDDVDVRVESSITIPTDVHTYDNDPSDAECEPVVEFTVTTFSYPASSQLLEFFPIIQREVYYDFFSFSGCLEICHESSIPLRESVAHLFRYPCIPFLYLQEL